jgi:type 1 fimbriae regulatory protein FimB
MHYLSKDELRRLFKVAYDKDRKFHLALLTMFCHGMRVSELTNLRGSDVMVAEGLVIVRRLKGSEETIQPIRHDTDVLFDESPLITLAQERRSLRLFEISRQHVDRLFKQYGALAGLHIDKCHAHALKHSTAMQIWDVSNNLGMVQSFLGHRAASSTLIYLRENDARKAQVAFSNIRF